MNIFITAPDDGFILGRALADPIERQSFAYGARVARAVRRPVCAEVQEWQGDPALYSRIQEFLMQAMRKVWMPS